MKSIWLQEKFVGGEFLGEKYMAARKKCGEKRGRRGCWLSSPPSQVLLMRWAELIVVLPLWT